jgi:catechol 2,3-dioxygenase-like lactoylglutathione lyase family enzyme
MRGTIEVVQVPVTDVDRAKAFYADQLGFDVDLDMLMGPGARIVQLTPPSSGCSIQIGSTAMAPGSLKGLQLVVRDIRAAHAELAERGVANSGIQVFAQEGRRPYRDGDELDNVGFCFFDDPDGNSWAVQQISSRP